MLYTKVQVSFQEKSNFIKDIKIIKEILSLASKRKWTVNCLKHKICNTVNILY